MTSPFVFNIAGLTDFAQRTQTGPNPTRIGPEMIGLAEGEEITVEATLSQLGGGILVDADVRGRLTGQCVRCLTELHPQLELHVTQVFSVSPDFVTGEEGDEADDLPEVVGDKIDLLQSVIDEAGLTLPFNPTCEGGCEETDTPAPDGVSGEFKPVDPRWTDLEKFL
ncbi:YceD family protein [Corynebacterium sp. YIM 101645]|uniref:YceD family protein n=1 Tax=Corynebacterium lemuris TaxID=1859292 RepID=A0ABT2FZD7_9CORY|nr:YceD family protein [Corynebacterium lemuris]MCS5479299.1 YceD family protein [Corynebacterium lemuris]